MSASAPEADVKSGYCHRPRWPFAVGGIARRVIQDPKPELRIMRYELNDHKWAPIKPFLPNKPRGIPRVNDRRVLNGIFWILRSGAPWRDVPDNFGPYTTCCNRFVRWRRAGVWARIMQALAGTHDAAVQMIDRSMTACISTAPGITRNVGAERATTHSRPTTLPSSSLRPYAWARESTSYYF